MSFPSNEAFRQATLDQFGFTGVVASGGGHVAPAPVPASGYQQTLDQVRHGQVGVSAVQQTVDQRGLVGEWRVPPVQHGHGGHGQDELHRTSDATRGLSAMAPLVSQAELEQQAYRRSMDRQDTAASIWYDASGNLGGHPGALRTPEQLARGSGTTNTGHASRDIARSNAVKAEFSADPHFGFIHQARAQVETVRTMTTPVEEFQHRGPPATSIFNARTGDMADPATFAATAHYVGDRREVMKWDASRKLMGTTAEAHVPPVIAHYINAHKGDHHQALQQYQHDVAAGHIVASTAAHSLAGPLASHETLAGTAPQVATGRARALSDPRRMSKP